MYIEMRDEIETGLPQYYESNQWSGQSQADFAKEMLPKYLDDLDQAKGDLEATYQDDWFDLDLEMQNELAELHASIVCEKLSS